MAEQHSQTGYHRRLPASMVAALNLMAPGTELRAGLNRILQAQGGAIIVLDGQGLDAIRWGGFPLNVELTEQRLSELAKMDGAIVLSPDGSRILAANVELMPLPEIHTRETGTRHRAAERTSRQLESPTIAVSEDMRIITLYVGEEKYVLQATPALLQRANQALATLERYRLRLEQLLESLSQLELQDLVTVDEVADALGCYEVVRRISEEIDRFVLELGGDGRLIKLQLDELIAGMDDEARLLARDYCRPARGRAHERTLAALAEVDDDELWSTDAIAAVLGTPTDDGERVVSPRGYRLLSKIPRLPPSVVDGLVRRFDTLERIRKASVEDLMEVDGVGEARARSIVTGLERLVEPGLV